MRGFCGLGVAGALLVGCSALLDTAELAGGDAPDAGGADAGAAELPDGAGPCAVLHVSPSGDDGRDGCTTTAAVKTIGRALALAKARQPFRGEIHVCRGLYPETLVLDVPVSVVGSYDCGSWQQDALVGPGWDPPTVIRPPAGTVAFSVAGAIDRSTRLEALRIEGPQTGDQPSVALSIAGASPTVLHSRVVGGRTTSTGEAASAAVYVQALGAPDILESFLDGGIGTALGTGIASVALRLVGAGEVHVARSTVTGGRGSATTASLPTLGIIAKNSTLLVEDSTVDGGSGKSTLNGGTGVFVQPDAKVTLSRSRVSAGQTVGTTGTGAAIQINGTGVVDRCRISGGYPAGPPPASWTLGVVVGGTAKNVLLTNNAIHAGTARPGDASGAVTIGVALLAGSSGTVVRYNTVFAGPGGGSAGAATALQVNAGALDVTMSDNLAFGDVASTAVTGLVYGDCGTTTWSAFRGNVFFGLGTVATRITGAGCNQPNAVASVDALEASLGNAASGNHELRATCASASCIVAPSCALPGAACTSSVLASWSEATAGTATFDGDGFALGATAPCAVTKPAGTAAAPPPTLAVDLAGAARTPPFSVGASEADGACAP